MRSPLRDLASVPGLILHTLLYGAEEHAELVAKIERLEDELTWERDPDVRGSLANQLAFAASLAGEQVAYADRFGGELQRARAQAAGYLAALQKIAEIIECGSVVAAEVPDKVRELITGLRAEIEGLADKLAAMVDADTAGGWRQWATLWAKESDAERQRAALWELLKRAVRVYRGEREWRGRAVRQLTECTNERDAAHRAITSVSAALLERTVALGQAREEIEQLARRLAMAEGCAQDLATLEVERDELEAQLADSATEVRQLLEDLAHARNQLAGPLGGDMVTLHVGRDKTVTGKLLVYPNGDRYVAGWLVDIPGRTLVRASDGGES